MYYIKIFQAILIVFLGSHGYLNAFNTEEGQVYIKKEFEEIEPARNIKRLLSIDTIRANLRKINPRLKTTNCVFCSVECYNLLKNQADITTWSPPKFEYEVDDDFDNMVCDDLYAVFKKAQDNALINSSTLRLDVDEGTTEPVPVTFEAVVFDEEGSYKTLRDYFKAVRLESLDGSAEFRVGLLYLILKDNDQVGHMVNFYCQSGQGNKYYIIDAQYRSVKSFDNFLRAERNNYLNYAYVWYDKGENSPPIEALKSFIKIEENEPAVLAEVEAIKPVLKKIIRRRAPLVTESVKPEAVKTQEHHAQEEIAEKRPAITLQPEQIYFDILDCNIGITEQRLSDQINGISVMQHLINGAIQFKKKKGDWYRILHRYAQDIGENLLRSDSTPVNGYKIRRFLDAKGQLFNNDLSPKLFQKYNEIKKHSPEELKKLEREYVTRRANELLEGRYKGRIARAIAKTLRRYKPLLEEDVVLKLKLFAKKS